MIERGQRENPTVLIVDDEPGVLESLADLLRRHFHVLATSDTDEALALLEAEEVSVILSDQRMPKMNGAELLTKASGLSPDTVRVLLTGYADIEVVVQAVNDAKIFYYLSKPWKNEKILDLVRTAVQTHSLAIKERRLMKDLGGLQVQQALSSLRPDAAGDSRDLLSRGVAEMRAGIASAQAWRSPLSQNLAQIPVCTSCRRTRTSDAAWTSLVEFLRASSLPVSDVLCPDCAARGGA